MKRERFSSSSFSDVCSPRLPAQPPQQQQRQQQQEQEGLEQERVYDMGLDTEMDEVGQGQQGASASAGEDRGLRGAGGISGSGSGQQQQIAGGEEWLASPVIPQDFKEQVIPGNIRRADHFVKFLQCAPPSSIHAQPKDMPPNLSLHPSLVCADG